MSEETRRKAIESWRNANNGPTWRGEAVDALTAHMRDELEPLMKAYRREAEDIARGIESAHVVRGHDEAHDVQGEQPTPAKCEECGYPLTPSDEYGGHARDCSKRNKSPLDDVQPSPTTEAPETSAELFASEFSRRWRAASECHERMATSVGKWVADVVEKRVAETVARALNQALPTFVEIMKPGRGESLLDAARRVVAERDENIRALESIESSHIRVVGQRNEALYDRDAALAKVRELEEQLNLSVNAGGEMLKKYQTAERELGEARVLIEAYRARMTKITEACVEPRVKP